MKQLTAFICSAAIAVSGIAAAIPAQPDLFLNAAAVSEADEAALGTYTAVSGYANSPAETTTTQTEPVAVPVAKGGTAKFDEASGTLTLSGNVLADDVTAFAKYEGVKKIVCAAGTVLPKDSKALFANSCAESIDLSNADTSNVTNMWGWFQNCKNLTDLNISGFKTSKVTKMAFMFSDCVSLEKLDVSSLDTSNVTNMARMFNQCSALTEIDLSKFNTAKVTSMSGMFANCHALEKLDLSSFDTSSCTDIGFMFYNCDALTDLNVSSFNTSNVTTIQQTFCSLDHLTTLDISNFDTTNVKNMSSMFSSSYELTVLDLSNFNTPNLESASSMFAYAKKLKTVYVSEGWSNAKIASEDKMFSGCYALVGGNGTVYDMDHVGPAYARIDKAGEPGYFTYKAAGTPAPVVTTTAANANTTTTTAITTTKAVPVTTAVTTTKAVPATTTAVTTTKAVPATTTAVTTTKAVPATTTKITTATVISKTTTATTMTTIAKTTTTSAGSGNQEPWTDSYKIKNGGHYFIIGDVCGKPGDTVDVPVYIFGDTGTCGIQTFFGYDKALTLNKFNMSKDNYAYRISAQRNTATYPASYVLATDQTMTAKDGSILTLLNFTIPTTAKEGTCYDITFMDDSDYVRMVVDRNSLPLNVKYYNGSITVLSDSKPALNRTSVSFSKAGETANLTLFNAVGEVKWSSSNPQIATVDENGFVTAVGPGAATITAENGGKTYNVSVTCMAVPATHEDGQRGDYDGDGEITATDAQNVLIAYTEELTSGKSTLTDAQFSACDVDGDGKITVADAQYILIYFTENTVTGNPTTWDDLIKK